MATFLELRQKVSRRLTQPLTAVNKGAGNVDDIPLTGVFWTRQTVGDFINEGYRYIYSEIAKIEAPTYTVIVDGTYTGSSLNVSMQTLLSISEDPLAIIDVRDVTNATDGFGVPLSYLGLASMQRGAPGSASELAVRTTNQRGWRLYGNTPMRLELWPTPQTDLTIRVRYIPAIPTELAVDTADDATGDSSVPSGVQTLHHDLLVMYAVVQCKKMEEDVSWRDDEETFERRLERLRETAEERQQQSGRGTHVVDPYEYQGAWPGHR